MEGSLFRALMGLAPRRGRSCVEGTAFASCAARRTRGSSETTTKTPGKAYRSDLWRVMAFARRLVVPARLLFAALRACGTPCDVFAGRYRAWASGGEVRRASRIPANLLKGENGCVRSLLAMPPRRRPRYYILTRRLFLTRRSYHPPRPLSRSRLALQPGEHPPRRDPHRLRGVDTPEGPASASGATKRSKKSLSPA